MLSHITFDNITNFPHIDHVESLLQVGVLLRYIIDPNPSGRRVLIKLQPLPQ